MRNIELLPILESERKLMRERRDKFLAYTGVAVDILSVEDNIIKIRVEQKVVKNHNFYSQKQLTENAKHLFMDAQLDGYRLHYIPLTFKPRFENVNTDWIKENMNKYDLKSVDIVKHIGLDKSTVSTLLSGGRELTKSQKAAFYYYFMVFDLNADIRAFLNSSDSE